MVRFIELANRIVWGVPALVLILAVGGYLTLRTGFAQVLLFPKAFRLFLSKFTASKSDNTSVSAYRALCTALAATVGTGNLAGVAGAIALGGPGAVFWMWLCAILGMITKFAEATLAVRYRSVNEQGETVGGPMYIISRGMGKKWSWLAAVYCFFGVVASFGVGNATQINVMISGIRSAVSTLGTELPEYGNLLIGIGLAVLIGVMLFGGAKRIGKVAEQLVPFASIAYILLAGGIILSKAYRVPDAFSSIFYGAFCPRAVTGGVLGSCFISLRVGASRGVFTNEAGMGTASIAHAAADVANPAEQGLMGIVEVFLDTIVICTMTALAILCSGVSIPYGTDAGLNLTTQAFASVYGAWISLPLSVFLCCFAIATVLGWSLYGARCAQYLFGASVWKRFVILQMITVIVGSIVNAQTVWMLSETVNGLMAIPNLIMLAVLSPDVIKITKEYRMLARMRSGNGGTYENINQCKSMRAVTYAQISSPGGESEGRGKENLPFKYRSAGHRNTEGVL